MATNEVTAQKIARLEKQLAELEKSDLNSRELLPQLVECHMNLSDLYQYSHQLEKAYAELQVAMKFAGRNFNLKFKAGLIAFEMGSIGEAGLQWMDAVNGDAPELINEIAAKILEVKTLPLEPELAEVLSKILLDWSELLPKDLQAQIQKKFSLKGSSKQMALALAESSFKRDPTCCFYFRAKSAIALDEENLIEAANQLEQYVSRRPNPYYLALARQYRIQKQNDLTTNSSVDESFQGASHYYNAGTVYQQLFWPVPQGSPVRQILRDLAVQCYDLAVAKFEAHFKNRRGVADDSDHHIYSMCCRNRAMIARLEEDFEGAILLHSKGIEASPFYEHYQERSDSYYKLDRLIDAGEDSAIILSNFIENLSPGLVVIHFYRVIRASLDAKNLEQANEVAHSAMEFIESLTPNDRKSLENKLPILYEVIATTFGQTGQTEIAEKIKREFGEKSKIQDETKALLTQATEFLKQQKYAEALPIFEKVNLIQPRNIDALNWRMWILETLKNQAPGEKMKFNSQIQELCETTIDLMTTPSPEWIYAPKMAMMKGFESALGNMAWKLLEESDDEDQLLTAVTMIDEAVEEVYNCYRRDDTRYLLDTKVRLLLKLKQNDLAYLTVQKVLARDEMFADFQDIKSSSEFQEWSKSSIPRKLFPRENYFYSGPNKFQVRPKYQLLLSGFIKESVLEYFKFRKAQHSQPSEEEFDISPEAFSFGREILKLDQGQMKLCLHLSFSRDKDLLPELGLLDNLEGESPVQHYALASLSSRLLEMDLDLDENELVLFLNSNLLNQEVLQAIEAYVDKKGLSVKLTEELKQFSQLAEPEERDLVGNILKAK